MKGKTALAQLKVVYPMLGSSTQVNSTGCSKWNMLVNDFKLHN